MNRKLKIHLIAFAVPIIAFALFLVIYLCSTMSTDGIRKEALKNTIVGSEEFLIGSFNGFDYYYQVSTDLDKDNEIRFYENKDVRFLQLIKIGGRYENYFSVSSDEPVGSVYADFDHRYNGDTQSLLIYYSNNKDKIASCVLQVQDEQDNIFNRTVEINQYYSFVFEVECVLNFRNTRMNVLKASFYDADGNLVYEDNRGSAVKTAEIE